MDRGYVGALAFLSKDVSKSQSLRRARKASVAQCPPVAVTLQTFVGVTGERTLRRNCNQIGQLHAHGSHLSEAE